MNHQRHPPVYNDVTSCSAHSQCIRDMICRIHNGICVFHFYAVANGVARVRFPDVDYHVHTNYSRWMYFPFLCIPQFVCVFMVYMTYVVLMYSYNTPRSSNLHSVLY